MGKLNFRTVTDISLYVTPMPFIITNLFTIGAY